MWTLPFFLLLALVTALGFGLWISALKCHLPGCGLYSALPDPALDADPIAYSSQEVPEQWQLVYALNPMVGVVEGFRWALLGADKPPGPMVIVSAVISLVVLVTGMYYFEGWKKLSRIWCKNFG